MTVMLCGLAEIRMEMSLPDMRVQLMILPATSFRTMHATPHRCFESSPQYQILRLSSVVVSPKPVHLTSATSRMSHRWHFNSWVSSCIFPQACREWMFHGLIVVPSFGSPMVIRYVVSLLCLASCPFSGLLGKGWRCSSPPQVS